MRAIKVSGSVFQKHQNNRRQNQENVFVKHLGRLHMVLYPSNKSHIVTLPFGPIPKNLIRCRILCAVCVVQIWFIPNNPVMRYCVHMPLVAF